MRRISFMYVCHLLKCQGSGYLALSTVGARQEEERVNVGICNTSWLWRIEERIARSFGGTLMIPCEEEGRGEENRRRRGVCLSLIYLLVGNIL